MDTNFSAKPIYDYLIKTGAEVFVVGGNPEDALAKSAKNYINLDYSKISELKALIKKLAVDYLVPGGNDFSYKICSEINTYFNFCNIDSIEVEQIIDDKEKFRKFTSNINLHVPRIIESDQIKDFLPVIVKPVDAYSGRGMTIVYEVNNDKIAEAINLAKKFSKSRKYIIEEFVQGQLYSHSAFIVDGEIMIDFIVEEYCIVNPYVVDTSRVIFNFDKNILNQIRNDITLFAKRLNLADGLMHTQFICDGNTFWLIEANRRCPGDLYSKLIEYSTGFPYAEYYARPFINETNKISNFEIVKSNVFRHTVTVGVKGIFNSISISSPINILEFTPLSLTGDRIEESPFSRIGLMFGYLSSESDLLQLINKAINRTLYSIN